MLPALGGEDYGGFLFQKIERKLLIYLEYLEILVLHMGDATMG